MRRKIALAIVLCLAAALSIGAAPALAASGCTCHTDASPTATPAHAPFVASITDCTTCHVGWVVPHPDFIEPALTARLKGAGDIIHYIYVLTGGLSIPWVPLAGVTVYPQGKAAGATDWSTIPPLAATDGAGFWESRWVAAPAGTTFRAISEGVAGPPVVMPALSGPFQRPIPTLTLKLRGLTHGAVALGKRLTAMGKVMPVELAGQKATIRLQRFYLAWPGRTHKAWRTVLKAERTIGAAGGFSWRFTPKVRGQYRIRPFIKGTAAYRGVTTEWRNFRVK